MKKFIVLLLIVSVAIYINTLWNEFVFDDIKILELNPLTKTFDLKILTEDFWYPDRSGSYRPLTTLTYSLNYFMSGNVLNSSIYHSFNLLINALNVVLVFLIVKELTKSDKISLLTALLFALHPIHVEAVATMFGRPDLLYMFFIFAVFLFHIKDYKLKKISPKIVYLLSVFLFFLSMLSKETAVTLIGFIVLYDVAFKRDLWKFKFKYLGYLLVVLIWFSMRTYFNIGSITEGTSFIDNPLINAPIGERAVHGIKLVGLYIHKLMYPIQLSVDYSYNQIPLVVDYLTVLSIVLLSALMIGLYISFRKNRLIFFSLGFLILSLIPVSNILIPVGSIFAERFMYVPSFGFVLLIAVGIYSIKNRNLKLVLIIVILSLYSVRTFMRIGDLNNGLTLWEKTVEVSPMSTKAHDNLAVSYLERNRPDDAIYELNQSLTIYPLFADAINNLGVAYGMKGDYMYAIEILQRGVELFPEHTRMKENLARARSLMENI